MHNKTQTIFSLTALYIITPTIISFFFEQYVFFARIIYCMILFLISYIVTKQKKDVILQIILYLFISIMLFTYLFQENHGYWQSIKSMFDSRFVLYVYEIISIFFGGLVKIYIKKVETPQTNATI